MRRLMRDEWQERFRPNIVTSEAPHAGRNQHRPRPPNTEPRGFAATGRRHPMARLTDLTFRQHGVDHDIRGGGYSLTHDQGANKDWTYKIPRARTGDYVVIAVDTPVAHPSVDISAQMVPG